MAFVSSPTGPHPATDKKNRPLVPVGFTRSGTHNSFAVLEEVTRQEEERDRIEDAAAALADAASASGSGVGATTTGPSVSFDAATDSSAGHHHPPGLEAAVHGGRRWGGRLLLFRSALGAVAVGLPLAVAFVVRAYSAGPPSSSPHWR